MEDKPTVCEFCGSNELYSLRLTRDLQAIKCCECFALLSITGVTDAEEKTNHDEARDGASYPSS